MIYDKYNANYNHHNKRWNEGQVISSMLDKNKTIATKGKSWKVTPPTSASHTTPVGRNRIILSHNAAHVLSSWEGDAVCTTFFSATFPLKAKLAIVVALGLYFGQPGAGDADGFLANDATIVWKVLDSCTSDAVALVRLYVPNSSMTISCRWSASWE